MQTADKLPDRNIFVDVVVKAERAYSPIHGREALILIEQSRTVAEKPANEIINFT